MQEFVSSSFFFFFFFFKRKPVGFLKTEVVWCFVSCLQEDAREREIAAREGRPYRTREERERLKKEREEREKREREESQRRGDSDGNALRLRRFDAGVAYYKVLGVDESASSKEIKRAYKKLALRYHPDKMTGKSEEERAEAEKIFKEAMEAYEILVDEDTRERYDKERDKRKYGKNSPMDDPDFAMKVARMRERARKERERKMNTKEERVEVIIVVTMSDLYNGCVKDVNYNKRYFERNESGEFVKYKPVTKVLEIRKGWCPTDPLVLDSEGHESVEYQTGDVHCILQEQEHECFERANVKDLAMKDYLCPKYSEGDMLKLVSIKTLSGMYENRVISYLSLLLAGGGSRTERIHGCGMPDPKAPWFDSPGDLLFQVSVPRAKSYCFEVAKSCVRPEKIYMVGDESNCLQAAAAALNVCVNHKDTLFAQSPTERSGVCICFGSHLSQGAETFLRTVEIMVRGFTWLVLRLGEDTQDLLASSPGLLDEELEALDTAAIVMTDPGLETPEIKHLVAPLDTTAVEESNACTNSKKIESADVPVAAMSFGVGAYGQLALGERNTRCHTFREMALGDPGEGGQVRPVSVSAGESHSGVVLSNGDVLTSGMGNYGQTGRPGSGSSFTLGPIEWDYFTEKAKVVSMACGGKHTLLLDDRGQVWALGCGKYGQLGHGDTYDLDEPQCVWPLQDGAGEPKCSAIQVAAGTSHSMMCDSSGRVWSWGLNSNGQLGLGDFEERHSPQLLTFFDGQKLAASSVSLGKANSAFLTADGKVFTCGSSKSKALGYPSTKDRALPTLIEAFASHMAKVSLQEDIGAACDNDGKLYCWGASDSKHQERSSTGASTFTYRVVHEKVVVRSSPSTSSQIVGVKYSGDVVHAQKKRSGWIQLSQQSYPKGTLAKGSSFWMLIDGTHLKLGLLLQEISDQAQSNKIESGVVPKCLRFDKFVEDVACYGREIVASCREEGVWIISEEDALGSERGTVNVKEICSASGPGVCSSVLSASLSHVMVICHPRQATSDNQPQESDQRGHSPTEDKDMEVEIARMSTLLQHHNLYPALWNAFLRGSVLVSLGESCSLLGVNRDNCGEDGPPMHALIPHVVRRCNPEGGVRRLHAAAQRLAPRFSKSNAAPYNDIMAASFLQHSCCTWDPKKQDLDVFISAPEDVRRGAEADADRYLSDLCLSRDEIGGQALSACWTDTMALHAITAATSRAQDRLRLKEEREENLRHIREEEFKAMGEWVQQGQRSNFDVFGCERGKCENCDECECYAQPLHMGLASGSYAFLCASCGCSHSQHSEVVH